jgi:Lon protease-like protein
VEPAEENGNGSGARAGDGASGGVSEIPLFPLGVVLFPTMLLPLHIFEERYKEMVHRCVRESIPFGVVLISEGQSVGGKAKTFRIGCTARIARVERMPDGRMMIEVVGEQRFRILDQHEALPYRTGLTEVLRDAPAPDAPSLAVLASEVERLLRDFLSRQLALLGQSVGHFDLPGEPEELSFTAACVLPLENDEKQALLEDTDTASRLTVEREVLLREVTRLRRAAEAMDTAPVPADDEDDETVETVEVVFTPVRSDRFSDYLCEN